MSSAELTEDSAFRTFLQHAYESTREANSLAKLSEKAWDHFCKMGLPSRRNEEYQHLRLRTLYEERYVLSPSTSLQEESILPHLLPECTRSRIVFVNGHYAPQLTDISALQGQLFVMPLTEAMNTYGAFLKNRWNKWAKEERDPFALLNGALQQEGIFIYVPPKVRLEAPVQLLHLITPSLDNSMIMARMHLFAGARSNLDLVFTLASDASSRFWLGQHFDFALEEGAEVRHNHLTFDAETARIFDSLRVTLKRDSRFQAVSVSKGSKMAHQDYLVELLGENCEAALEGLYYLEKSLQMHTHVNMRHEAPHCRSRQLFKGMLDGSSRSSFDGKIFVAKEAQKTDAFQLNNNLLLSDDAAAHSKPNLEIFADDVKASHGATVGQLDPEHLYYLRSRGLSEKDAKALLVYGYVKEVIDAISIASIRDYASQKVLQGLLRGQS